MEGIFSGCVELALDKKGRMQIPPIWFEMTGRSKHVYVMPDPVEKCLRLVSACSMESLLVKMRERALTDSAMNRALQVVGKNAEQIAVDDENSIRISEKLLAFAGITRQLVMVGGEWYTQLWSPEELNRKAQSGHPAEFASKF